jgi:pimeloyl-ACP methyl ester carboxylesterase
MDGGDEFAMPTLMRSARGAYARAIRAQLRLIGISDMPRNGAVILAGIDASGGPRQDLPAELGVTKQAVSQPAFVATLAAGHKVVMFDNAGVGQTATAAPSITAMANQASALISTLRLGRAAVLGWSMGGMIAQALAVLHPAQVSQLILAATQPGTGDARPIPAAAAAAAASPDPAAVLSVLFPPAQAAAEQAYGLRRHGTSSPILEHVPVLAKRSLVPARP